MMVEWLHRFGLTEAASSHAGDLDRMLAVVHWLMLILFVGWGTFFIYTLVRFRAKKNPKADPEGVKSHFSSYLEVGVALFEAALLIGFAFPLWARTKTVLPQPGAAATETRVVAQQFAWNVHYPGEDGVFGRTFPHLVNPRAGNPIGLDCADPAAQDDIVLVGQYHIPANEVALVRLSSLDVIHSFALPEMRVKQDAIPGMSVPVWFTPVKDGKYEIACAQLCGLGHYYMRGFMTVHPEGEYEVWRASEERFCAPEEDEEHSEF